MPDGLDLAQAAPLLCAGITTYSPLRTWNIGPGGRVGVIGLGGLGHMAVKLAVAMGANVTVMSRTNDKKAKALALGADRFLASTDAEAMAKAQSGDETPLLYDCAEEETSPKIRVRTLKLLSFPTDLADGGAYVEGL